MPGSSSAHYISHCLFVVLLIHWFSWLRCNHRSHLSHQARETQDPSVTASRMLMFARRNESDRKTISCFGKIRYSGMWEGGSWRPRAPTSARWETAISCRRMSPLLAVATVKTRRFLWLLWTRLVKCGRTKRDWLSEVERRGQSELIRQTKCYFCFLCGWGASGGEQKGSLITSAISVVSASPPPAPPPIPALFTLKLNPPLVFFSMYKPQRLFSHISLCVCVFVETCIKPIIFFFF